ncbi:MAG: glutathione S-transferase family protein [Ahrensia sp.]|nr:glutathione S-transferase family protein [Ahrensia sp.]
MTITTPVKLYGSPQSRLTRASWMCEELGIAYDIVAAKPHSDALKALNPAGKGPVLVDDDVVVIDSAAICLYLADKHADKGFCAPPGTAERASLDSWMMFAQLDLEGPLWLKLKHKFLLPETLRCDLKDNPKREFDAAIAAMEARLGDGQFALGDQFSAADIILGHCGQWARGGKFQINSDAVNAYFDRVLSRPALSRAHKVEERLLS